MTDAVTMNAPRAAAGSAEQLPRVELELKQEAPTGLPIILPSSAKRKPQVNLQPFTVNITRLTQEEIEK